MKKIFFIALVLFSIASQAQNLKRYGGTGWINTLHGDWFYNSHPSYGSSDSLKLVDYAQLYRALNSIGGVGGSAAIGSLVTGGTAGSALYIGTNGLLQQSNSVYFYDSINNRLAIGTNAASSRLDVVTNSLGVTQANTSGISLRNTTAAAAGAQQMSPGLLFEGNGWKTNATAASQPVRWRISVLPVQGAANPSSTLQFESSINGAAYTLPMSVTSGGNLTIPGSLTASGNVVAGAVLGLGNSSSPVGWSSWSRFFAPVDGAIRMTNQAGATFSYLLWGSADVNHFMIKNNTTTAQFREGNDSDFKPVEGKGRAYNESTYDGSSRFVTEDAFRDQTEAIKDKPWSQTAQLFQLTSGNTPTNMGVTTGSMTLPDNCVGMMKIELVANGGAGAATHKIQGARYYTFNKNGSTLTIDAADVIIADKEGASVTAASWQLISSSNQPVVEVTGVTAIDFNWAASVTITYVIKS